MQEAGTWGRDGAKPRRRRAFDRRWVRCTGCYRKFVTLIGKPEKRLRDRRSPCCQERMHVLNWKGWNEGRA